MYNENNFLTSIRQSYNPNDGNSRRSDRLRPIHTYIGGEISEIFGPDYGLRATAFTNVSGIYYDKKVPVSVSRDNQNQLVVGFKFVTRNFTQNANNYFQSLLGEAANIQTNGLKYAFVFIIPTKIRYNRNNGNVAGFQDLKAAHLKKYIRLYTEHLDNEDYFHRPLTVGCLVVDIDYERSIIGPANLRNLFGEEFAADFRHTISMDNFYDKITEFRNTL